MTTTQQPRYAVGDQVRLRRNGPPWKIVGIEPATATRGTGYIVKRDNHHSTKTVDEDRVTRVGASN